MLVRDVFKLFQPVNDKTGSIDYIITWVALYDYHHDPYCYPDIKISSDCKPELILSEKVLNSKVIGMSAEDLDVILIRIEKTGAGVVLALVKYLSLIVVLISGFAVC